MNLKKGEKTKVFSNELKTKFYVAWVKDISYMQNVTKIDAEKILENALNKINYGLLEELLNYLHKINKVKVNTKNLIFTSDF
jgi:UDP-N-acetyl-D-mannosaminuronate dehydrogenase